MALSIGIVGLPNVGKSTLFNALLKKQQALAANYPFATIEPNVGVVEVPDRRLEFLAETIASQSSKSQVSISDQFSNFNFQFQNKDKWPPVVPAVVKFVDIAGLVSGAHKGEGLGNKFLAHIRETSVVCHVLRDFSDTNVLREGSSNPKKDFETIETELLMADLATLEKQPNFAKASLGKKEPDPNAVRAKVVVKLKEAVEAGTPAREVELNDEEEKYAKELSLLTAKPILVAINVDEEGLSKSKQVELEYSKILNIEENQIVVVSAKMESELAGLDADEQQEYLSDLGISQSGLERLIEKAYKTLGLISFLTAGEKEVRAWTLPFGFSAVRASGVIHTDFEKNFIKADVISFDDFVKLNGWKGARDAGKVRSEGREYIVQDGDVIEFKVNV